MVDESAPAGQNEDWDLLLRCSARAPIAHVDRPLVWVRWGSSSMFAAAWESKLAGLRWVLDGHPGIAGDPLGYARVLGQMAFAEAALHRRRAALGTAVRAGRVRWREPRGYLATAVALGVPPGVILSALHRRGHGV